MEASALRAPAGLTRLALPSALLRLRSDEQLVAAFRQGSEDAFRVIHDRYRARLFAYTRQMLGGSRSDAEDALQDVFLRAYNALRADERPVVLKAWLYRVAHNRCIDHLRRPTPPPSDVFEMSRTPMPDPLAEAERRDDLRRLVADVQRLPEQQRSALLMREMEGLSYADLAQALDTTVPAVKSLLVRARIGLVEAAEARNTACTEIRDDLTLSFGKGVRASAIARKHMRECTGCTQYRQDLRAVQHGLTALAPPAHPLGGLLAKLLGLGAGGGGAAAGGTAAAGGGAAIAGGGVVAGTTAKVAAVVCCAALTAGGAAEIGKRAGVAGETQRSGAAERSAAAASAERPVRVAAKSAVPPAAIAAATRARRAAAAATASAAARQRRTAAAAAPVPMVLEEEPISQHQLAEEPSLPMLVPADAVSAPPTGGELAPIENPSAMSPSSSASPSPSSSPPASQPQAVASPPATTGTSAPASSGTSSGSGASTASPTATGGQPPSSEGAASAPSGG